MVEEEQASTELYRYVYGKDPDEIPQHISEADDENRPLNDVVKAWLKEQDLNYDIELGARSSQIRISLGIAGENHDLFIDIDEEDDQASTFI